VVGLLLVAAAPVRLQEPQRKPSPTKQLFPVINNDGHGFIDGTGRMVIAPRFRSQYYSPGFREGLAAVKIDGQWCYIDETGKVVIRTSGFDVVGPFTEGLASIGVSKRTPDGEEDMKYGYIDRTGRLVIQPQYDETYGFSEGLGRVVMNHKWGFIDKAGKMVIEPHFISAYWFSEGFASVGLESGARVYIDHYGKIASNPEYEYTDAWFAEGLAPAAKGGKWGFVDRNWKMVIEPQFDYTAQSFSEGLAMVRIDGPQGHIDGKYGFVDRNGKMVIPPRFEQPAGSFHDGRAWIQMNGKLGYINRSGEIVIQPQFTSAGSFRGGLAAVTSNEQVRHLSVCCNNWDYIDTTGKYVWRATGAPNR
jgi:hypothetical protein